MKLRDLHESSSPFVKFGGWQLFNSNNEIEGMTSFAVPTSGPALLTYTPNGKFQLSLSTDPDGELAAPDQISVLIRSDDDVEFQKTWPDTKDGYRLARKYAEKLRQGQDPTK